MADNVTTTTTVSTIPSGTVIAADDVGGALYQRVKLSLGADGTVADAPVGGGTEAGVLRVTLASDSTGVLSVDDNGGSLTVDVGAALPAGTNNIGDVDVLSVIPGTGATSLGKAIDSAVGATDTGVAMLAKRSDEDNVITAANGDYDVLRIDSRGALHASPEQHIIFDGFDATTGWTALSNDTLNLATTLKHLTGTAALTFDKVNGAANTVFAGIQKTITTVNLGDIAMHDLIQGSLYIPDITDVSYMFIRLGTDSTNYNEWRIPDTNITQATFITIAAAIGDANYAGITGNGWNPSSVSYIAVGVAFDAETNTLAGIVFDRVSYHTNLHTSASFSTEISSDVTTPNVNLHRVGGTAVASNSGVVGNGTLRVTLATDVALPAGTNAIGKLAANSGVDIGDVDVVSLTGSSVAHDAADSGNPHKIGGQARTTNPTAVADGDRVNFTADDLGRQVMVVGQVRDLITHAHTQIASSSSETTILAAGAAGVFHDLVQLVITNATATAVNVTIKDATAGTTRMIIALAASGGAVIPFTRPLTQASAANNWTATLSSAAVTVNFLTVAEKNV